MFSLCLHFGFYTNYDEYSSTRSSVVNTSQRDVEHKTHQEQLTDFKESVEHLSSEEYDTQFRKWQQNKIDKILKDVQTYSQQKKDQIQPALDNITRDLLEVPPALAAIKRAGVYWNQIR